MSRKTVGLSVRLILALVGGAIAASLFFGERSDGELEPIEVLSRAGLHFIITSAKEGLIR